MDFLGGMLKTFLSGAVIKALAKKTGLKTRDLKKFLPLAVPVLLKNLTNNASDEAGASSLLAALAQHSDDKSVDRQIADADVADGAKIIGHIFGGKESDELKLLSKQSALSETAVSGVLNSIAPALLTYLSRAIFGRKRRSSGRTSVLGRVLGGIFNLVKPKSRRRKKADDAFTGASLLSALLSLK